MKPIIIFSIVFSLTCAQDSTISTGSIEETTTNLPPTTTTIDIDIEEETVEKNVEQNVIQDDNPGVKTSTSSGEFLPTPTLGSNIVTALVPSLKKNILNAKNARNESLEETSENEVKKQPIFKQDIFKRRHDTGPVTIVKRNSTAAEILLKKVKSQNRYRTYHAPTFKSKKLVRVRPRAKTLKELQESGSDVSPTIQTEITSSKAPNFNGSPILTSNVLLMNDQSKIAPQGAQPFDWSKRQSRFKNRFKLLKTSRVTTEPPKASTENEVTKVPVTTAAPVTEVEESTEVHVVTSISDEIGVSPTLGTSTTPKPTSPITNKKSSITNKSPGSYS